MTENEHQACTNLIDAIDRLTDEQQNRILDELTRRVEARLKARKRRGLLVPVNDFDPDGPHRLA